jgi:hypothetical protein
VDAFGVFRHERGVAVGQRLVEARREHEPETAGGVRAAVKPFNLSGFGHLSVVSGQ